MEIDENGRKSKFAIISLILGFIGLFTSFIPIINNLSFILAIIAIIISLLCLFKKSGQKTAIISIIISVITIILVLVSQKTLSDSINNTVNEINNNIDTATGKKTDEVLSDFLDVNIGTYSSITDEFGFTSTELPVTITNKGSESKSFNIQIEAINPDGSRIDTDYISADNLGANQSQNFKIFEYVEDDKVDAMKNATFKIVESSMY